MRSLSAWPLALWLSLVAFAADEANERAQHPQGPEPPHLQLMHELASDRVVSAQIRVSREYESTVNVLVYLLQKAPSDGRRRIYMDLLGEMRARHAVAPLIKQITFVYSRLLVLDWTDPLRQYPAAKALARIGEPAVHSILVERLPKAASDQELQLFAAVIREHHRLHPEVGHFRIKDHVAKLDQRLQDTSLTEWERNRTSTWRKNLARLLEFYEAIDRGELFPLFRPFSGLPLETKAQKAEK
jgi:hypothetical protein